MDDTIEVDLVSPQPWITVMGTLLLEYLTYPEFLQLYSKKFEQHILRSQRLKPSDVRPLLNGRQILWDDLIEGDTITFIVTHWDRVLLMVFLC
jgi:hypothetical protein